MEERDAEGKGLGTFSVRKFYRKAPPPAFVQIHKRSTIGKRIARKKLLPSISKPKLLASKALKSEERDGWIEATRQGLHALKQQVEPTGGGRSA